MSTSQDGTVPEQPGDPKLPLSKTVVQLASAEATSFRETVEYQVGDSNAPTSPSKTNPLSFELAPAAHPVLVQRPAPPGYELLEELGRGGMGVVYKARQTRLDRLVALKMILGGAHAGPGHLARFQTEALAEARLQHPNIVQIYEIGEHEGLPYFSLEYVPGGNLAEHVGRTPQAPREAAALIETLARAIHHAHDQGIVHRDLKPANVLLYGHGMPSVGFGTPKIADFGLAKVCADDATQTHSGVLLGTPSYMAPEQAAGQSHSVGPAADQYSLGAMLYELLSGRAPFQGPTLTDTLEQVRTREPVSPRQLQPGVPLDLETICLRCLQKEPARRYSSCAALADDLRRFLEGRPILARPVGAVERCWRWCRRNPRIAALGAAVLLLLLVIAATSTTFALLLAHKQQETELARQDAMTGWERADLNAVAAQSARQLAEKNAGLARDRYQLAMDALDVVVNKVRAQLEELPDTSGVREDILETLLKVLQEAVGRDDGTGLAGRGMAGAHLQLGEIYWLRNEHQKAVDQFKVALTLTEKLWQEAPHSDKAIGNYALSLRRQGDLFRDLKRDYATARSYYEKTLALQQGVAEHPQDGDWPADEVQQSLAITHERLADLAMREEKLDEAEREYGLSLPIRVEQVQRHPGPGARNNVAVVEFGLGKLAERRGKQTEALHHHEAALTLMREVVREQPARVLPKENLVSAAGVVGDLYLMAGDAAHARNTYQLALEPGEQLQLLYPSVGHEEALAMNCYRLGTATLRLGERTEAQKLYNRCLQIRELIIRKYGSTEKREINVMIARARSGQHVPAAAAAAAFEKRAPRNAGLLYQVACAYALCRDAVPSADPLHAEYTRQALEAVRRLRTAGWKDLHALEVDPDLDPLRAEKDFAAILEDWKHPSPGQTPP